MKLPEFGVKKPVTTMMIFIAILVIGGVALSQLPIDLLPDISLPAMGVITSYRGASTEEIETKITKVIESDVSTQSTASSLKRISLRR